MYRVPVLLSSTLFSVLIFSSFLFCSSAVRQGTTRVHSISALDCRKPAKISSWDISSLCTSTKDDTSKDTKVDTVSIIQESTTGKVRAARCDRRVSRFVMYCGAYSHAKLSTPPDILQPEPMSTEQCMTLYSTNTYYGTHGSVMHVPMNSRKVMKTFEHGSVVFGAYNTECKGSDTEIDGERHTNVVVYVTISVELKEVTLVYEDGKVVDTDESTTLPTTCVTDGSCVGGEFVYKIIDKVNTCNFRLIRTVPMTRVLLPHGEKREEDYWISEEHKLILRKNGEIQISGCPGVTSAWRSEYPSLYFIIGNTPTNLETATADTVNTELTIKVTEEYLLFRLESQMYSKLQDLTEQLCSVSSANLQTLERSPFHKNALIRIRGQVAQEYSCTEITIQVQEGATSEKNCYDSLFPINYEGKAMFLDAMTMSLVENGELHTVNCKHHYTAIIKSNQGIYLQADPDIRPIDIKISPIHDMFTLRRQNHEEEGDDLLYTEEEIRAFQELVHFSRTKSQVLDGLVRSYCTQPNACGYVTSSSGSFDLKNLLSDAIPVIGWWEYILEKTQEVGQVASIVVAIYLFFSAIEHVVSTLLAARKYDIPLQAAARININLVSHLRALLYEHHVKNRIIPTPTPQGEAQNNHNQPGMTEFELRPVPSNSMAVEGPLP